MQIEELQERLKKKENQVNQIKTYLLDAIYEVKAAYNFDSEQYTKSSVLAMYQDILNKIIELEVK